MISKILLPKSIKLLFIIFIFLFFQIQIKAEESNKEILTNIEKYLNDLKNLEASFAQSINQGSPYAFGKIYISKPGKARFDYKEPKELSVVINNDDLIFYDKELDQTTFLETPEIIKNILLKSQINLQKDLDVKSLQETDEFYYLTIASEKDAKILGQKIGFTEAIFVFEKNPIKLINILREEKENQYINIALTDRKLDDKINSELFEINAKEAFQKKFRRKN